MVGLDAQSLWFRSGSDDEIELEADGDRCVPTASRLEAPLFQGSRNRADEAPIVSRDGLNVGDLAFG